MPASDAGVSAIYRDCCACDEAGVFAAEEGDDRSDLKVFTDKLRVFNSKTFQKKEGSRISIFLGEEKPLLMPLPAVRYELATWKKATVQFNYHVAVDKMYYERPFNA